MFDSAKIKQEFRAVVEWLKKEFTQISTGRANPALLDSIMIESYGTRQPVKNIATIGTEDARTLRIAPWDKSQIKEIEKAIHASGLPLSLAVDDAGLRASIPELTAENKTALVKVVSAKHEEARVRVRNIREHAMKDIAGGEYSEDERHSYKEQLQKEVDAVNKELHEMFERKEADITSV